MVPGSWIIRRDTKRFNATDVAVDSATIPTKLLKIIAALNAIIIFVL